jgi:hypothetical protein
MKLMKRQWIKKKKNSSAENLFTTVFLNNYDNIEYDCRTKT